VCSSDLDPAAALWLGGYPEPALHPDRRDLWVRSYIGTYIERDVRQMRNVRDLRSFETFLGVCAARHGQAFDTAALARDCGVALPTIKSWGGLLDASYIVHLLRPYFRNFGKRVVKTPKLYFLDPTPVCDLTMQPGAAAALAGAMGGALFEGLMIAEAIKAFTNRGMRPQVWFWRTQDGHEVDLVIAAGGKLIPVEIKLTATPTVRHADPLARFVKVAGAEAEPGLLVCRVERDTPFTEGHRALPWQRFPAWLAKRLA
jgi:predicted AAA+ superfamily ATPase